MGFARITQHQIQINFEKSLSTQTAYRVAITVLIIIGFL